jgi:drug/metabolite transporter (DMT)-like permease
MGGAGMSAGAAAARAGAVLARALGLADAPQAAAPGARALEGAALMITSTFFLACSNAMVRALAPDAHPFMAGFFLNLIGLLTIWPWVRREGWAGVRMKAYGLHAIRGTVGAGTLMAWMWALAEVELAKATALSFTAPLFAAGAASLLMGEPARRARWAALGVGFAGTLVILRPGTMALDTGTIVAMVAAVGMAAMYLTTKLLLRHESSGGVIVNTAMVMTPLSFIVALPYWSWPPADIWPLIVAMGLTGTLGRILLTRALQAADASVVMPFDFGRLVFIAVIGAAFFGETPDAFTVIGSLAIAGAAAFLTRAEARVPAAIVPPPATGDQETCSRTKRP